MFVIATVTSHYSEERLPPLFLAKLRSHALLSMSASYKNDKSSTTAVYVPLLICLSYNPD